MTHNLFEILSRQLQIRINLILIYKPSTIQFTVIFTLMTIVQRRYTFSYALLVICVSVNTCRGNNKNNLSLLSINLSFKNLLSNLSSHMSVCIYIFTDKETCRHQDSILDLKLEETVELLVYIIVVFSIF